MYKQVVQLEGAFSTEFEEPHKHFVQFPVTPGVQACLIELRQLDGSVKLIDAVTIIPSSVPNRALMDPIYAAYLKLIEHEYRPDIALAEAVREHHRLAAIRYSEAPFACPIQTDVRLRVFGVVENLEKDTQLCRKDRQMIARKIDQAVEEILWHPRHIVCGRTSRRRKEAWVILGRMDKWELQKPANWEKRLREFNADLKKRTVRKSHEKDALKKRYAWVCKHVGLRPGDLSKLNRLQYLAAGQFPDRRITI